jgi:hypothetical protein
MRGAIGIAVIGAVLACGCGSSGGGGAGAPPPDPAVVDQPPVPTPPEPATPEPTPGPAPASGDAASVRIVATPAGSGAAIEVTNTGGGVVRLRPAISLEREQRGAWSARDSRAELALRWDCQTPAPTDCVTLVSGASLHPPNWLGTIGDAQCICTRCGPAPPGRYRFVGATCDGMRIEGTAFDWR